MNWIVNSLIMFSSWVVFYLFIRRQQLLQWDSTFINLIAFSCSFLCFLLIAIFFGVQISISPANFLLLFLASLLFSYVGLSLSLYGTKHAPNPGFSLIIQKSYFVYTAIAAVPLFQAEFTWKSLIASLLIIFFLFLISYEPRKNTAQTGNGKWLLASGIAFFGFGNLALFSKWLLTQGVSAYTRTIFGQLNVSIFFLLEILLKRKQGRLKFPQAKRQDIFSFLMIALACGLANLFMNEAYNTAPNVGYVNIINASSITLITLLAAYFFKDRLSWQKVIGIFGVLVGMIILLV